MSGLSGTVGLLNNGGDDLSISSNGGFTFSTSLVNGASYAVTVGTQPAGQTCEVGQRNGDDRQRERDGRVSDLLRRSAASAATGFGVHGGRNGEWSVGHGRAAEQRRRRPVRLVERWLHVLDFAGGRRLVRRDGRDAAGRPDLRGGQRNGDDPSANVTDVSVTCADDPPPPPPPTTVSYAADVQPYFNSNCTGCHGGSNPQKGVDLTSYQQVMAGGDGGAIVIPGES